jgi:hypothetical protein
MFSKPSEPIGLCLLRDIEKRRKNGEAERTRTLATVDTNTRGRGDGNHEREDKVGHRQVLCARTPGPNKITRTREGEEMGTTNERIRLAIDRSYVPGRQDQTKSPCSAALISMTYQLWYSVFFSQQNSHSRLINRRNSLPNRVNISIVKKKYFCFGIM